MGTLGFWALAEETAGAQPPKSATRILTVARVDDDGTAWAQMPEGGEIPIATATASVKPGDSVTVNIEGGRATISGNATDLPAPTTRVDGVQMQAEQAGADAARAADAAKAAKDIAAEAQAVADATAQHFFSDDNGAHITDVTQDEWVEAVDDNFSDYDPDTKPYHNQLLNSLGILLRTALNNLVSITRSAIAFFDGQGNNAENIVARFGSDGAQIGTANDAHVTIDSNAMAVYTGADSAGKKLIAGLANDPATGLATVRVTGLLDRYTVVDGVSYYVLKHGGVIPSSFTSLKIDGTTIGSFTLTYDSLNILIDKNTYSSYAYKPVEVVYETASPVPILFYGTTSAGYEVGANSVAFGKNPRAPGLESFACGSYATAKGAASIALGLNVYADGSASVALGNQSTTGAGASSAIAAGFSAIANGAYSVAIGDGVVASCAGETVIGCYNDYANDQVPRPGMTGDYILVIGNGLGDSQRSNAFTLDWDGNGEFAGDVSAVDGVFSGDVSGANGTFSGNIEAGGRFIGPLAYGSYYGYTDLALTTAFQNLALSTFSGDGVTKSGDGVRIDKAGVYLVLGSCYCFTGYTANDIVHLAIYQNSNAVCDVLSRMYSANPYQTMQASAILACSAGDVIKLSARNQTGARGTVANRDNYGLSVVQIA